MLNRRDWSRNVRARETSAGDIDLATNIDRRRAYIDGEVARLIAPTMLHFVVIAEVIILDDVADHLALPRLEIDLLEVLQLLLGTDNGTLDVAYVELNDLLTLDIADIGHLHAYGARIDGGYAISELRVAQTIAEGENYA